MAQGDIDPEMVVEYSPGGKTYASVWEKVVDAAERFNEPSRFTAFIGFEWTSLVAGNNLHRNVIFRDGADKAGRVVPYTTQPPVGSTDPLDLYAYLESYEKTIGGSALALAHNGNLSNGRMFSVETFDGRPLTVELAAMRSRFEPVVEVTQIKGDGEAHPYLSPNDDFADFDTWDRSNLNGTEAGTPDMLKYEYAREALKTGLMLDATLGVNPYKFGMIGSNDAHTALAGVEEDNFFGKHSGVEPEPHRWEHIVIEAPDPRFNVMGWQQAAAGYAAVWARENTREAIFDALMRKETYATTGSRITVRFSGGWDFVPADANTRLPASVGYAKGVPMGGDLRLAPAGTSPTFLVAAMKDSSSGNLDRIQIVKGWMDGKGELHEKVHDVVWRGDRKPGADGELPAVGSTVDVANATWTNTIGSPELIGVWTAPDFDANESAFYYARVIEIPTPRWTAYEAKRFRVDISPEVPMTTSERAYTSPIWYNP